MAALLLHAYICHLDLIQSSLLLYFVYLMQ